MTYNVFSGTLNRTQSVVFPRWRQCDSVSYIPVGICTIPMLPPVESLWVHRPPGMSWVGCFSCSKLRLHVKICTHGSFTSHESASQMTAWSVQPLYYVYYCILCACVGLWHGEVDLVGLKPILRTTTSFSALTLLVGSFDPQKPSPKWPVMCLVGR